MTDIPINPVTRRVQFAGTTGTGPFAFNFNILQATDIVVLKNNVVLSIGTGSTNYSVSIASNGTGSVSLVTALISSDTLIIMGGRELSRTTDFVTAGDLLASSLNEQLDSNVVMSQQIDEKVNRSIIAQPGDKLVGVNLSLPLVADRANEIIKFDASGNVTTIPVSEIVGTDIDTQKVTIKTSAGATKLVINGNITDLITAAGNLNIVSTSGDIDFKPGGGQINLLGTSGQQRIAFDNAAQATMQYFQNSNVTKLGVVDPTATRTLLLPNASDTLVGKATTDTLTNKTLASPVISGSLAVGTITGSGDILLDAVGDIVLDAAGDQVFFKDGGTLRITFNIGAAGTSMVSASELVMAVTSGGINFKPSNGNVDFLQSSGAQAIQINSGGSSTVTYYQNSNTTKLGVVSPTASRVLLLPNASDTLVGKATTDTLTNKTLANPAFTGNLNFSGDVAIDASGDITLDADGGEIFIKDGGALKLTFTGSTLTSTGLAGINLFSSNDIALKAAGGQVDFLGTSGEQRILIANDAAPTIKYFQNSNTTSLGIVNPTATRTILFPNASDTLVGKATTDILTNKTLNSPTITGGLNMSDVNITNVGSISLDRIASDGGTGINLDSSGLIIIDSGNGQALFKQNGATRLTFTHTASGLQTLTAAGIFSITAAADINLRPNGGQLYVLNGNGGDNFQFNTSATPTLGIHQNSNVTNLGLVNPTATRNILFPNASDTLVGKATTDTLTNKTITSPVLNTGVSGSAFLDEDNFASNSATKIASQQSIKAYVDAATAGGGAGSLSTVLGIGNTTGSNDVLFGDNNKAIFGADSDLKISHSGSAAIINNNTGDLSIQSDGNLKLERKDGGEDYIHCIADGAVELHHNGSKKIETTATGVDITGTNNTITAKITNTDGANYLQITNGTANGYFGTTGADTVSVLSIGAHPVTFGTNGGTERMRIDSSGNVGIGITAPLAKLNIKGDTTSFGGMAKIYLTDLNGNSASRNWSIGNGGSGFGNLTFAVSAAKDGNAGDGTAVNAMVITSSKTVGINCTPASSTFLDVKGKMTLRRNVPAGDASTGNWTFNISHENSAVYGSLYLTSGVATGELDLMGSKFRFTKAGELLIGKTVTALGTAGVRITPSGISATRANGSMMTLNLTGNDAEVIGFYKNTGYIANIGVSGSNNLYISGTVANHCGITLGTNQLMPTVVSSIVNGTVDLGGSGGRWKQLFATNSTISTSDRNEKQDIAALTSTEMLVAKRISALFKTFRWKDKVATEGDDARTHTGTIAQDVQSAFSAEGLDAGDYSLFTSGSWWEHDVEVAAVEADDTAKPAIEAADAYTRTDIHNIESEAPEGSTRQTRLGIRYSELLSFLAAYNEQRFAAIETRLTVLEG